jgi:hypothetical protein
LTALVDGERPSLLTIKTKPDGIKAGKEEKFIRINGDNPVGFVVENGKAGVKPAFPKDAGSKEINPSVTKGCERPWR